MAAIDQGGQYDRALRKQEYDRRIEAEQRTALWTFVWVLFGFKVVSIGILAYWIEWNEIKYLIGLTTWPWVVIPTIALTPPILNRLRMRRIRRKRAALKSAEFDHAAGPASPGVTVLDADGNLISRRSRPEPES